MLSREARNRQRADLGKRHDWIVVGRMRDLPVARVHFEVPRRVYQNERPTPFANRHHASRYRQFRGTLLSTVVVLPSLKSSALGCGAEELRLCLRRKPGRLLGFMNRKASADDGFLQFGHAVLEHDVGTFY